ncbi:MAG TPA: hypothetical protein VHA79_06230 [Mycobacteriales bacterium]|nr:hypothetical protein [Mycobacteriales bacterium]
MPSRFRVTSPRALAAVAMVMIAGVLGLGTAATGAAPAQHAGAPTHAAVMAGPGRKGDNVLRLIPWSGRSWLVYSNSSKGPEGVKLTNSSRAIWVDSRGRLHLHIVKIDGVWRSVELRSVSTVSYGTYRLINDTATAKFADSTVFGMFVYKPGTKTYTNEIDIENSRFPRYLKAPNNAQFAVQPYNQANHAHPYHVKPSYVPLFQQFSWYPPVHGSGTVKFQTRVGSTPHSPLLTRWTYYGGSSPTANNMYLYIDLWLNHGKAPKNGTHSAILRSLTVTPFGNG